MRKIFWQLLCLLLAGNAMAQSPADFDGNGKVDVGDLAVLANFWLESPIQQNINLDGIGKVDMKDFGIFNSWWQWEYSSVVKEDWAFGGNGDCVGAARYAGLYAVASRASDVVEVRNIGQELVGSITAAEIKALMGTSDISGGDYGPCALAFSDSGRYLFISVVSKTGQANKDRVLQFNTVTKQLRSFISLELSHSNSACGNLGLAFNKGKLYVGTANGSLLGYEANMNDAEGTYFGSVSLVNEDAGKSLKSIAIDLLDDKMYIASANRIYRLDLLNPTALHEVANINGIKSMTFGRTYGGLGQGGLYVLGEDSNLVFANSEALRTGGMVNFNSYHNDNNIVDIAATACGRMLVAGESVGVISDIIDTRLDFDEWVQDEFDQYILFAKTLCWPDGEPIGWVIGTQRKAGVGRIHPPSPGGAAWAVMMLILADEINGDADAKWMIREILKRYAGLQGDGIGPVVSADGEFHHWYDADTGQVAWDTDGTNIFSTMKIIAASVRAKEYYADDAEIVNAANVIIAKQKNKRDMIHAFGRADCRTDDLGPMTDGITFGPFVETYLYAEEVAALDPMCEFSYKDYWLDRTKNKYDYYLVDQPVVKSNFAAFVQLYARQCMKAIRDDELWRNDFNNLYSTFCGWTDDNGPDYLTVFSAGVKPDGAYNADNIKNHPGTVAHFPALIGYSLHGDSTPTVGAYFAYRDGRRQAMSGTSNYPGAKLLTRYSNEDPSWLLNGLALPDSSFGAFALAELIEPGVLERTVAIETYKEPEASPMAEGDIKLEFSKLTRRRVIASVDGENWDSFGFQNTPFVFDGNEGYQYFDAIGAEGNFVDVRSAGFESGWSGWYSFGDYTKFTAAGAINIVGSSLCVAVTSSHNSLVAGMEQDIDVAEDFEGTGYIVRALGSLATEANGKGYLRIIWDDDADKNNGFISEQISLYLDANNIDDELMVNAIKPANANVMRIGLVVEKGSSVVTTEKYVFDEVSIVRIGAEIAFNNSGFELNSFSGWSKSTPTNSSIAIINDDTYAAKYVLKPWLSNNKEVSLNHDYDIANDPVDTRYIVRAKVITGNLQGSYAYLRARMYDSANAYTRDITGDSVEIANTSREIYFSIRKRDIVDDHLRLFVRVKRTDRSAVTADEIIVFDDIRLTKQLP